MSYTPSPLKHWFSHKTRVSIELPIGWEQDEEDERLVIYRDTSAAHEWPPTLLIRVIHIPFAADEPHLELARQIVDVSRPNKQILSHSKMDVDGFDGVVDVLSYDEEQVGHTVIHYQVFVNVPPLIYSFSGMAQREHAQSCLPVFRAAVQSVRFIPPDKARG